MSFFARISTTLHKLPPVSVQDSIHDSAALTSSHKGLNIVQAEIRIKASVEIKAIVFTGYWWQVAR